MEICIKDLDRVNMLKEGETWVCDNYVVFINPNISREQSVRSILPVPNRKLRKPLVLQTPKGDAL